MSSGTLSALTASLKANFSAPTTPYPLPEDLQQTIEAFLEHYHDISDHDSQRLQDELLPLYKKNVADAPEKHGPFLGALRLLQPAIRGESRLEEWWTLAIRPTIDALGHKRDEIEDARSFLQELLVFDADDDKDGERSRVSAHFTMKLLDAYLARTKIPSADEDCVSPEDEFIAHELESQVVAFGRRKPKELLVALDALFVKKDTRAQALNLLSAFVRVQPPHLYLVLETQLMQHLETCLMVDTSATVIELALTVLIMFLPHITSLLTTDLHLSKLFLIYSRLLCWDQFEKAEPEQKKKEDATGIEKAVPRLPEETITVLCRASDILSSSASGLLQSSHEAEPGWEKMDRSFDSTESTAPGLLHYFTFLYGLFPLNFMSYIRKPRKYLKTVEFPGADDFEFDQDLIRSRTDPFRQVHLLHPNMFNTTPEDELSDNRWLKSDPADVVTECMELCVAVSSSLDDPGPPPTSKLPDLPPQLPDIPAPLNVTSRNEDVPQSGIFILDDDGTMMKDEPSTSWRNTQSTMFSPSGNEESDEPELPSRKSFISANKSSIPPSPILKPRDVGDSPTLPPLSSISDWENKTGLKKKPSRDLRKGGTISAPHSATPPSPRLENFAQTLTQTQLSTSPSRGDVQGQSVASLQREIMLLKNDLNFERYLKLQHLSHIGQLQRKHIKEATAEAETQNLINSNRTLKAKLAKANELYTQLKKETQTGRSQSKKWESELSSKVRSYREESKTWHSDEESMRVDIQKAQKDCDRLRRLVVESEAREFHAKQKLKSMELDLEQLENLQREVDALKEKVQKLQGVNAELEPTRMERDSLRSDLEIANLKLNSRDVERERTRKTFERRILDLENRLQTAQAQGQGATQPGQLPRSVQQMLDSTMAASNAKMDKLKKTHYRLLDQYTELEMRLHELEGENQAQVGRMNSMSSRGQSSMTNIKEDAPYQYLNRQAAAPVSNTANPRYTRPLVTDHPQQYDYYNEYNSPNSTSSPANYNYPARPVRLESLQQEKHGKDPITPTQDLSAAYETSLNASFQSPNKPETVHSSSKSSWSVETGSSAERRKAKVAPKSDVRVYGRGGAQNVGKKIKDKAEKAEKKDKAPKTGGFRGLKGIM
ncbi:uncharacterized protein BDZ99DRAFT_174048 [Mytilinidion resinicola]|uniref:Hamartin n=1 Tax=Mytilinidion resinicola TaxID=574789 RepID=A0A6A6Y4B8_9PEZI|nr:uncharacterized protein BDZ99DRAFT_174048 [Mytilinidion resinicola]KAF2803075.1 hypothetical protein BDZ99DRAFT_174048 [Mytilinidion resinicola]